MGALTRILDQLCCLALDRSFPVRGRGITSSRYHETSILPQSYLAAWIQIRDAARFCPRLPALQRAVLCPVTSMGQLTCLSLRTQKMSIECRMWSSGNPLHVALTSRQLDGARLLRGRHHFVKTSLVLVYGRRNLETAVAARA
jgi:hypothetical protein